MEYGTWKQRVPTSWRWAWRTALRDARGSRIKALLYAMAMAVGIAALVAMVSFGEDVARAVKDQARIMLGSDLQLRSRQSFSTELEAWARDLGAERAHVLWLATMGYFPRQDEAIFCRIRAIDGDFPFYGTLITEPENAAHTYQDGAFALIDRTIQERLGVVVGDPLKLGQATFTISGILIETPGEPASSVLFGPRIFIGGQQLAATELIQPGSRVFYTMAFRFPQGFDTDGLVAEQEDRFKQERITWDTVATRRQELGEAMARTGNFLSLTACLALLLGGIGVAAAVHYHLRQKQRQVAVLRCLGATVTQVFLVFLLQVGLMALFATLLGILVGIGLQFAVPALVQDLLPVVYTPQFDLKAVGVATAWGLFMSLWLALAPLLKIRKISASASFRSHLSGGERDPLVFLVYAGAALVWGCFAWWRTGSFVVAVTYLAALIAGILLLWLTARLLAWAARKLAIYGLSFAWRQGLSSLFRPQNQTVIMTIILGMGVFLVTVLMGSRSMLVQEFQGALDSVRPNFMAFDIQPDQVEGVHRLMEDSRLPVYDSMPLLPMRLLSLKGQPVESLMGGDIPDWALQREYRSTYRATLTETEALLEGNFVSKVDPLIDEIPVSLEEDIARQLQLGLGDPFEVDVMGLPMKARVQSIRKVDWQSLQPNFYMVFPLGPLDAAPQMYLVTTKTDGPAQVAALQRALVTQFPNVTCVDMTELVARIDAILDKAAGAVRFLALLCMLTGLMLLGMALWNSRYERLGEHALLRTLGALRIQITRISLAEYFLLGFFSAASGSLLAYGGSWALGRFLFKLERMPELSIFLLPLVVLPFLTMVMGFLGHRGLWRRRPLHILREEAS